MTTITEAIALSIREGRTVTLYPETEAEQAAMHEELLAACDDSADFSGAGYLGPEARGRTAFWGEAEGSAWCVDVTNYLQEF